GDADVLPETECRLGSGECIGVSAGCPQHAGAGSRVSQAHLWLARVAKLRGCEHRLGSLDLPALAIDHCGVDETHSRGFAQLGVRETCGVRKGIAPTAELELRRDESRLEIDLVVAVAAPPGEHE